MRTGALLVACLICTADVRRVQRSSEQHQGLAETPRASEALASLLLGASDVAAAWQAPAIGHHSNLALQSHLGKRTGTIGMKKSKAGYTGSMPGKSRTQTMQGGFDEKRRKAMLAKDANSKWWVVVANDTDIPWEMGGNLAVDAGCSPTGTDFIWTLVRGDTPDTEYADPGEQKTLFCTVGSCMACNFPMLDSEVNKEADGTYAISCKLCGTKYSLDDGEVLDFLPAKNPVQWTQKVANSKKEPKKMGVLPVRISKKGLVRIRLPDGTLIKGVNYPPKGSIDLSA